MRITNRDYRDLLPEERISMEKIKEEEKVKTLGSFQIRRSKFREYPKAVRHHISLFPNNYLDPVELRENQGLDALLSNFTEIIKSESSIERDVLNFINQSNAHFIVGSLLYKHYNFGHHESYIFPEYKLGNSNAPDYFLIGKNSDGWNFVFVELESPNKNITLADGDFGEAFRKGLKQTEDWKFWLEENYNSSFRETLMKGISEEKTLPMEFITYDSTRIHYVVIAGKRRDFKEKTRRLRRKKQQESQTLLLHYDSLCDSAYEVIGRYTY